jgi:hypothetical protein
VTATAGGLKLIAGAGLEPLPGREDCCHHCVDVPRLQRCRLQCRLPLKLQAPSGLTRLAPRSTTHDPERKPPSSLFGALDIENVQHRAVWHSVTRTSSDCFRQEAFKLRKIDHLRSNILEVTSRDLFDFAAGGCSGRPETE